MEQMLMWVFILRETFRQRWDLPDGEPGEEPGRRTRDDGALREVRNDKSQGGHCHNGWGGVDHASTMRSK